MLHHQFVREVGIAFGILKPTAGKQCGGKPLTTDSSAWIFWVALVMWLFALHFFTVRAHCTCSTTRDLTSAAIAVRVKNIMTVENRFTIVHWCECFLKKFLWCSWYDRVAKTCDNWGWDGMDWELTSESPCKSVPRASKLMPILSAHSFTERLHY